MLAILASTKQLPFADCRLVLTDREESGKLVCWLLVCRLRYEVKIAQHGDF